MITPAQIKAWRGSRSQAEAGASIGRSARQIREFESGRATPDKAVQMAMEREKLGRDEQINAVVSYAPDKLKHGDTIRVYNPFRYPKGLTFFPEETNL